MDRRSLLSAVALGAAALASRAQTRAAMAGKVARVGILSSGQRPSDAELRQGQWARELHRLGWAEGQNLVYELRYADGRADLLPRFAQELVETEVDAIVAFASPDAAVARRLTSAIPILLVYNGMDPVEDGLIASFARPGGNVTGVSRMLGESRAKRLEFIGSLLPSGSRVAVLAPPQPSDAQQTRFESALRNAARTVALELQFHTYRDQDALAAAFPAIAAARVQAFLLEPTFQTFANRRRVAALAITHRLPGVFTLREYVEAGGLMAYGPDWPTIVRQLAQQLDRVLRGANPALLPMEQPNRFDLTINLATAGALGLTIPQSLLMRADEVIR